MGNIIDGSLKQAIGLPQQFQPTVPIIAGQNGAVKSFILPDNITGVLFLGSFSDDEANFQNDTVTAVNVFKQRGVKQLILDVTNNGGRLLQYVYFLNFSLFLFRRWLCLSRSMATSISGRV